MGITQHNLMEHIVYNVSGVMGLVLTWHHEGYRKTPAQMGEVLYHMTRHQEIQGGSFI